MSAEPRAMLAAVGFLTRLPLPAGAPALEAEDVRRATAYFPAVGAALGAGTGLIASRLSRRLTPPLAGALAVAAQTLATGALHLDALADTADGLGAGDRERALEVMRDPRLGSFGVSAVALDLLIKAAALAALARASRAAGGAAAAGALSRAVPVALAAVLPYARAEAGTGSALGETTTGRAVGAALLAAGLGVAGAGRDGFVLVAVASGLAAACARVYDRWLGGVTGDALGAAIELTETAVLVAAVALRATP
jgi:adenosylcobinamide-GDP ribazoletransferase